MVKRMGKRHFHETKRGTCDYHLCKKRTKIEKCIYCGSWFCGEHIAPIPPTFPNFVKEYSPEYLRWQNENGHGCPDYYDYLIKEHEKEQDEWGKTLDRLHEIKPGTLFDTKIPQEELDKMCSYHLCKQKTTLYTCTQCGQKYCATHLPARKPSSLRAKSTDKELAEEWRRDGHPCPNYYQGGTGKTQYFEKCDFKPTEEKHEEYHKPKGIKFTLREDLESFWYYNKPKIFKNIVILIIIIALAYLLFQKSNYEAIVAPLNDIMNYANTTLSSIGAVVGNILNGAANLLNSSTSDAGNYTNSIINSITDPEKKDASLSAFSYMNSLRRANGVNALEWNDNLYKFALSRAKDMSERNYFDHITPDGVCAMEYGGAIYGINQPVGENIAQGYGNQKEAVDGWMSSTGHRFNMMHPSHIYGAIAKYKDLYVFMGMGTALWTC